MLIRKDDLEAAVEHGVISAASARALTEFTEKRASAPRAANEQFRVVNNFAEVFICIGLIIVFSTTATLLSIVGYAYIAIPAVLFWLLTEFFTFRSIKTAPAIISALFTALLLVNVMLIYPGFGDGGGITSFKFINPTFVAMALCASIALVFVRFRLPILLLPLAASVTFLVFRISGASFSSSGFLWPIGLCGIAILATAIWLDARDPLRRSKWNAYAFWLFIIGSPLTIHPVIVSVVLASKDIGELPILVVVFTLALLATTVGLILDRRSLVASSLIYFTITIGYASQQLGGEIATTLAATGLIVGLSAVLLGVLWYRIRSALMRLLPFPGLKANLPPYL